MIFSHVFVIKIKQVKVLYYNKIYIKLYKKGFVVYLHYDIVDENLSRLLADLMLLKHTIFFTYLKLDVSKMVSTYLKCS